MDYNSFMADDNFYLNLLNMKPEIRDANFELLDKTIATGNLLRDEKLPFLLESPSFMERILDARKKLGLKNKQPIYSEPSSSAIKRLMNAPSREQLMELKLIPYDAEVAAKSRELIELMTESLESETDIESVATINRDIEDMREGATGYLGYHEAETRKFPYINYIIKQILSDSSLDESWYVIVENIILNGHHPDKAYSANLPIGVAIEDITPNGDVIIRVAKGCAKQEYVGAWENISRFTGKSARQPKTDSANKERDLGIIRDMNAGTPVSQVARKYFPHSIFDADLRSYIHKIYKRKSIK